MITGRSLWHLSAAESTLKKEDLPLPEKGTVLIRAAYSLISTGTERLVARGQVPETVEQDMEVPYMTGSFNFPIKYGYSLVARIVEEGHRQKGKWVHLLHPHQELCRVNYTDLSFIPDGIPPARATLSSNMETAINVVWDGGIGLGDKVLLVGFGLLGSLVARVVSQIPGTKLSIVEKNPRRIKLGRKMGFDIGPDTAESGFDRAVNASASAAGLQSCINLVGREGLVVEMSWYGEQKVSLHLGGSFHSQRKKIISSQVSQLPATQQARWSFKRRKQLVYALLKNPHYDSHLTDFIPFDESPAFFKRLREGNFTGLGHCIDYTSGAEQHL